MLHKSKKGLLLLVRQQNFQVAGQKDEGREAFILKTRPEVVNRCDSQYVTDFKREFVTGVMTGFIMEFMTLFMTLIRH